jgi:hypothetical protein
MCQTNRVRRNGSGGSNNATGEIGNLGPATRPYLPV